MKFEICLDYFLRRIEFLSNYLKHGKTTPTVISGTNNVTANGFNTIIQTEKKIKTINTFRIEPKWSCMKALVTTHCYVPLRFCIM